MQRTPMTAHAECADGACGDLAGLIVRADSRTLDWYVVRDTSPGHPIERLVPRARLHPAALNLVHLDCTLAELGKMQPLNLQELQVEANVKSGGNFYGHSGKYGLTDSERAPDGTGVLRQDQRVEATNGKIGKLSGILVDDEARITHFYTRLDKRGSDEVTLPVSAVYYVDRSTVYLQLDKRQVESLPSLPPMTDTCCEPAHKHMELMARVYDTPAGASQALDQLRQVQADAEHPINIREAAVLVRDGDGPPHVQDSGQTRAGKGAAMGVAAGGLLAILGPVGLAAGAVAGGALGGLAGSRIHLG